MDRQHWICASMWWTDDNDPLQLAGGLLLHPIALAATALLWLNDHEFKAAYPGIVTGKLSDLCGLVVFPLFLVGAVELGGLVVRRPVRFTARGMTGIAVVCGVVFASIQLSTVAADAYRWAFAARWLASGWLLYGVTDLPTTNHTMDATDCVALPALLIPVWLASRHRRLPTVPGSRSRDEAAGPTASP